VRLLLQEYQETTNGIAKLMEFPTAAKPTTTSGMAIVDMAINESDDKVAALLKKHRESLEAILGLTK